MDLRTLLIKLIEERAHVSHSDIHDVAKNDLQLYNTLQLLYNLVNQPKDKIDLSVDYVDLEHRVLANMLYAEEQFD